MRGERRLRESAAAGTAQGEAVAESAGRVDRAQFRALLRNRRHAAHAPAKARQHSQAFADSCGRSESGAVAEKPVWKRNAAEPPGAFAYLATFCGIDGTRPYEIKLSRSSARE